METTRLRHLLEQNGLTMMDVLQDILTELRGIRQEMGGEKTTEEEAQAMFWQDARHFEGNGYPVSRANEFRAHFPTYFTDNPGEADR